MIKIRLLCIFIMLLGISAFTCACFLLPSASPYYNWCLGLAGALIVIGLGYFLNTLLNAANRKNTLCPSSDAQEVESRYVKEKAGYLVCKTVNILLCIYLLILNKMQVKPSILLPGILLLLIQYLMDLILQLYFSLKGVNKTQ